jgi:hypothetical protein
MVLRERVGRYRQESFGFGCRPSVFLSCGACVFRVRSNGAAGFTNPSLTNLTNGYSVSSTRDAANGNSELKIDAGAVYGITDMLFDVEAYSRFIELCSRNGIAVPILPGTRLLKSRAQAERKIATLFSAAAGSFSSGRASRVARGTLTLNLAIIRSAWAPEGKETLFYSALIDGLL